MSHPNEDPTNSLWDTDITVMSYNARWWNTSYFKWFAGSKNDLGPRGRWLAPNIRTNDNTEKDLDNSIVDDFSQDTNTLGSISVGETINGSIEKVGDRDWFSRFNSWRNASTATRKGHQLQNLSLFFIIKISK